MICLNSVIVAEAGLSSHALTAPSVYVQLLTARAGDQSSGAQGAAENKKQKQEPNKSSRSKHSACGAKDPGPSLHAVPGHPENKNDAKARTSLLNVTAFTDVSLCPSVEYSHLVTRHQRSSMKVPMKKHRSVENECASEIVIGTFKSFRRDRSTESDAIAIQHSTQFSRPKSS